MSLVGIRLKLINELIDAMKAGKANDVLGGIITELTSYTVEHFQTEENYFDKYGYPETENHKKQHADFIAKVTEFKESFDSGQLAMSVGVLNFLTDWLRNHIKGSDKKYTAFFNEKGLR